METFIVELIDTDRYWIKGYNFETATYEAQTLMNLLDRYADGQLELWNSQHAGVSLSGY